MLMIHGGYGRDGELLSDFWFFNFKTFEWKKQAVYATSDSIYSSETTDTNKVAQKREINLKIAAHTFLPKGKFLIALGGVIDGDRCNFKRHLESKGMITVLYLPDMEAIEITSIADESPEILHGVFTGEHQVVSCSSGKLYVIAGILRLFFDKRMIDEAGRRDDILRDKNSYETRCNYVQVGLNGTIISFLPPSFTHLE